MGENHFSAEKGRNNGTGGRKMGTFWYIGTFWYKTGLKSLNIWIDVGICCCSLIEKTY